MRHFFLNSSLSPRLQTPCNCPLMRRPPVSDLFIRICAETYSRSPPPKPCWGALHHKLWLTWSRKTFRFTPKLPDCCYLSKESASMRIAASPKLWLQCRTRNGQRFLSVPALQRQRAGIEFCRQPILSLSFQSHTAMRVISVAWWSALQRAKLDATTANTPSTVARTRRFARAAPMLTACDAAPMPVFALWSFGGRTSR